MSQDDQERLKGFSRQANATVFSGTFDTQSFFYKRPKALEEIAKDACRDSAESFGSADPLHLDSLINLALFYSERVKRTSLAAKTLSGAVKLLSETHSSHPALLAKLLATAVLVKKRRSGGAISVAKTLTNTVSLPFGIPAYETAGRSAEIICAMAGATDQDSVIGTRYLLVPVNRLNDDEGELQFRATLRRLSEELYTEIFMPILGRLRSVAIKEIIFVPSGGLQLLPLHCAGFYDASTNERSTLLDEFRFRLAPSATVFRMLRARQLKRPLGGPSLVAGVVEYDDESLGSLPGVDAETESVANELGVNRLLNEAVTEAHLLDRCGDATYIHLACHGTSWAEDPNFARTFFARDALLFKQSGLSFQDILVGWNLRAARLVSLSACDTGLVDLSRPLNEFEGLANIFFQVGAQAVVGSLWSVDDESTGILMVRMYSNINARQMSLAEALREAQLWLRDATHAELLQIYPNLYRSEGSITSANERPYSDRYFWAPFVLNG